MAIPDEVKEFMAKEHKQQAYGIKLAAITVEIHEANEAIKKLENKRNRIIKILADNDMSVSRIAGISGLHRNKVSELIDYVAFHSEVNPEYMEDAPEWFGDESMT